MTQQENDNENISNDNFMKTIYSKVSDLKNIFQESQQQMGFTKSSFNHSFKNNTNKEKQKKQLDIQPSQFIKIQTTVNRIQINDQSKINRQQHIISQRIRHLSTSKTNMAQTLSSLSNLNFIKSLKHSKNQFISCNKHSSTPTEDQSNKKFSLTAPNFNQNNTNEKKSADNKWFISTQINKPKISPKGQKVQSKSQLSHTLLKDRKQNKMARILGFLDKNGDHSQKQKKLQQKLKEVKEIKQMTVITNRQRTISEIRSSLNARINEKNGRQIHKGQQELELEVDQQFKFKPIGSAKTLRRLTTNQQQKVKNQDQLVLSLAKSKTSEVKQNQNYDNKLSKTCKNSSDQKTYLAKGNRIREILNKKLSNNSSSKDQQLVYMKEYDQWVPSELVKNNKQQLQTYLQILMGNKKQPRHISAKLTLNDAEIIYF